MKLLKRFFSNNKASQRGFSLISTMLMLLVLSIFLVGGIGLYKVWHDYGLSADTAGDMEEIQKAIRQYVTENGHYPCPASLTAAIDTPTFGVASAANCQTAPEAAGTFRTAGRDGRTVRTGAVPVRTLGLPDSYTFDPYDKRYVYAVTETYAVAGTIVNGDNGAIQIIDAENNNATASPGNIVHTLFSMGHDNNGAYDTAGLLIQACDVTVDSGENCDFINRADSIFRNTLTKSYNENNLFTHKVTYSTAMTPPCTQTGTSPYKDIAFLLDTSGSMAEDPGQAYCPVGMEGCSRMDLARWALRRVLPTRIYNNQDMSDAGKTLFTGFVATGNVRNVEARLGDPTFNDPTSPQYTHPTEEAVNAALEERLQDMCPSGFTPLGIHMEALANRMGNGTETQPNKIIVISDGLSNDGRSPIAVANDIRNNYPNLQVDIIDLVGNDSMREVAERTGGQYFRTNNAAELIQQFQSSMQLCQTHSPQTPPVDRRGCGSGGNWGR